MTNKPNNDGNITTQPREQDKTVAIPLRDVAPILVRRAPPPPPPNSRPALSHQRPPPPKFVPPPTTAPSSFVTPLVSPPAPPHIANAPPMLVPRHVHFNNELDTNKRTTTMTTTPTSPSIDVYVHRQAIARQHIIVGALHEQRTQDSMRRELCGLEGDLARLRCKYEELTRKADTQECVLERHRAARSNLVYARGLLQKVKEENGKELCSTDTSEIFRLVDYACMLTG
eukprot:PhM_4_TR13429/c0_g1_i1/m.872